MTPKFHELLLSELRMVAYRPGDPADMTDERLCEAITLNENLQSLGFALRPDDLVRLSVSPSLEGFYDHVAALVPDVQDKPMYPGFPQQVMEMSEAEFRLHQMIHYFSTYGVERLLGGEVSRGWLPDSSAPKRTQADDRLMAARVIALVSEDEAAIAVLTALLNRRERLTNPELDLALECVPRCTTAQLQGLKVRFKENLDLLFPRLMAERDREATLRTLHAVCAHTGDVLRLGTDYLRARGYHLRTGEKKLLVKLLERYPAENLRQNLMQSLRVRERNLLLLRHLSFNAHSRSPEHREAVRALRNDELLSWHGVGEALLAAHSPEALTHLAQRPGYMVRALNRLLSLDYAPEAITEALLPRAGAISGHLILRVIRTLSKRREDIEANYRQERDDVMSGFQREEQAARPDYMTALDRVRWEAAQRRRKVTEAMDREKLRAREEAHEALRALRSRVELLERALEELKNGPPDPDYCPRHVSPHRGGSARYDAELAEASQFLQKAEVHRRADFLRERLFTMQAEADHRLARAYADIEAKYSTEELEAQLREIDNWEQAQQARLECEHARQAAVYQAFLRDLEVRRRAALSALKKRRDAALRMCAYDSGTVEILKEVLKAHFRQAVTPLKGKRVYPDLDPFDLAHSTLETEDRSKDGGYIRSGISYRIPEAARYVRFFVYWNDPNRVDVDLHAGGRTLDGQSLHVGWNADFRKGGVLHSGDITHSDAAEYIDIDLSAPIREIYANVNLFYGKYSFKGIETCYVGMMALKHIGQEVKRYNPANCFFTHALTQNTRNLFYGYIDVQNRFVRFVGQPNEFGWAARPAIESAENMFSLQDYLDCVLEAQGAEIVRSRDQAQAVLTMGKSGQANGVSLVDSNFFLEC